MTSEWDEIRPTPKDLNFKGVTSRYTDRAGVRIDEQEVPERLRHLIEYAKHWAIEDETERGDLMWLTPTEELRAFVNAVWPLRDEIKFWCLLHRDSVPEEVYLFDQMIWAVAEVTACHVEVDEDGDKSASREV